MVTIRGVGVFFKLDKKGLALSLRLRLCHVVLLSAVNASIPISQHHNLAAAWWAAQRKNKTEKVLLEEEEKAAEPQKKLRVPKWIFLIFFILRIERFSEQLASSFSGAIRIE